ncbi:MAG TPA: L,D-transpeptidase family protein [Acidimicrobiia bacterium]|nr:L,D-transpeptidase family protein [Acidimicrobiia bacterium]
MKKIITSRIFLGCCSGALALVIVVAIGYSIRENADATPVPKTVSTSTSTTTSSTTTTTLPHVLIQPAAAALPLVGAGQTIGSGTNSPNVALYEQRLADLKFDPGPIDTIYDAKTVFAVQGLQKLKGLSPTGRIGDAEVAALNAFQYDTPAGSLEEPTRFEVNLDNQVGILYKDYQVRLITTVSTGAGYSYSYNSERTGKHVKSVAITPTGKYAFGRRYKGWEKSDLGRLYNPVYFNGGIAVHGYTSVPTKAASHGCVRIPMYIAEYFPSLVAAGEPVYITAAVAVANIPDRYSNIATTTTTTTTTLPVETTTTTADTTPAPVVPPPL